MSARKPVMVVRHPDDPFGRIAYVIHLLMEEWRRRGVPVEVRIGVDGAPREDGNGDRGNGGGNGDGDADGAASAAVVIPHVDMTVTPPDYQDYFARCPVVLNRAVFDISKRIISRNLVPSPRDFDGPVIVKTNNNCAGTPELDRMKRKGRLGQLLLRAARRLPWTVTGLVGRNEYHIYDHPRLVPWVVWHNRRLVVEKFLPEKEGDLYCLRQYTFLGPCEINTLAWSPEPLVKAHNVVRREVLAETPPELRQLRRELGFDYGKFDYVIREGQVVLFDANRTPTYNAASQAGSASPLIMKLADGIDAYLEAA